MFLIPFHVDVPMGRWPLANILLIVVTFAVFAQIRAGLLTPEAILPYVLGTGSPRGLWGHAFIHFGWMHVIGNMVFLWTFGNAVCAKVGNLRYLALYFALACIAGLTHVVVDGRPGVGASGAVNGIVGMYFVLYPRNNVTCFYWFVIFIGRFHISSIWMILFWLAFDVYGGLQVVQHAAGAGHTAYWAHLGGFAAGFGVASISLWLGLIRMGDTEESLYGWLRG